MITRRISQVAVLALLPALLVGCPSAEQCARLNQIMLGVSIARQFAPGLLQSAGAPQATIDKFNAATQLLDETQAAIDEACAGPEIDNARIERLVRIAAGAAADIITIYLAFRSPPRGAIAGRDAQGDTCRKALADALDIANGGKR